MGCKGHYKSNPFGLIHPDFCPLEGSLVILSLIFILMVSNFSIPGFFWVTRKDPMWKWIEIIYFPYFVSFHLSSSLSSIQPSCILFNVKLGIGYIYFHSHAAPAAPIKIKLYQIWLLMICIVSSSKSCSQK